LASRTISRLASDFRRIDDGVDHLFGHVRSGGFRTTGDFLELPVLLFGPPIALLLFGLAAGWAFRGFKAENGPSGK
jgi:hypothetical protein